MRTLAGIMSPKSKIEYLESCRARYPSRNRVGRSAMIDGVRWRENDARTHHRPAKNGEAGRHGHSAGRTSHQLKSTTAVRCGPWEVDRPGWLEVDTVSHGGGSSSGEFLNTSVENHLLGQGRPPFRSIPKFREGPTKPYNQPDGTKPPLDIR